MRYIEMADACSSPHSRAHPMPTALVPAFSVPRYYVNVAERAPMLPKLMSELPDEDYKDWVGSASIVRAAHRKRTTSEPALVRRHVLILHR